MHAFLKTLLLVLSACISRVLPLRSSEPRVMVLMYHSVEESQWKYGVHPGAFKKHLRYLKDRYTVVTFDDVVEYVYGKKTLPDKSVALTFDDGYADTYEIVLPLLKEMGLFATVFLTTDLSPMNKLGTLARPYTEDIQNMYKSGHIVFEVHGQTHTNFTELKTDDDFEREIDASQRFIKDTLGYESRYVAYPAGRTSEKVKEYLRRKGYRAACAITEGPVRAGDDPYHIKRIQVDRTMSFLQFKLRLTRALDINRKMVNFVCAARNK